jgi:hypothetical protein
MVKRYKKLRLESFVSTLNSIVLAKLLVLETDFGFQRAGRSDGRSSPMPEYIDKLLAPYSFLPQDGLNVSFKTLSFSKMR